MRKRRQERKERRGRALDIRIPCLNHQKMKAAIVYHRIDFDGICSYAICKEVVSQYAAAYEDSCEVTPLPFNHGEAEPSADSLLAFDVIIIVDCCLSTPTMLRLASEGRCRVYWIDHHRTSISESKSRGFDTLMGLREEGRGACELCHEYFFGLDTTPHFVELLSAYDVWDKRRFDWERETLPLQYGMRNAFGLDAEAFSDAFLSERFEWEKILDDGLAIVKYIRQSGHHSCNVYGFEATVGGKAKAFCLLTASFGSLPMEEAAREHGCTVCLCVNRRTDGQYQVSAYSAGGDPGLDLGAYLKETYGGGGHPGAAGCQVEEDVFLRLLRDKQF